MRFDDGYLSDEELEQLILHVEQQEMVAAPPGLLDNILEGMEKSQQSKRSSGNKIKEFRGYCFRVMTSVAAAVAIVFLIPELMNTQVSEVPLKQSAIMTAKYATKEEALNDKGLFAQTFGGVNIFDNEKQLNIFSERDGGWFNETKER